MKRFLIITTVGFASLLAAACADMPLGPISPTAAYEAPPAEGGAFEARDFTWSQRGGGASIVGTLAFHGGGGRYTCQGGEYNEPLVIKPGGIKENIMIGITRK